jgi:hypothetical protein
LIRNSFIPGPSQSRPFPLPEDWDRARLENEASDKEQLYLIVHREGILSCYLKLEAEPDSNVANIFSVQTVDDICKKL